MNKLIVLITILTITIVPAVVGYFITGFNTPLYGKVAFGVTAGLIFPVYNYRYHEYSNTILATTVLISYMFVLLGASLA